MTLTQLTPTEDCYADELNPTTNYESATQLKSGWLTGDYDYEAFFEYDISSITVSEIDSALFRINLASSNGETYRIYRLTSTFDESTLTWNNRPTIDTSVYVDWTSTLSNFSDEAQLISLFENETASTFGIVVKPVNKSTQNVIDFISKEHATLTACKMYLYTSSYVRAIGGDDANGGASWSDAWGTVNKGMVTVSANSILHIGFGTYSNEPSNNKLSPDAPNVTVVFETATTGGGTGTATIEVNL